MFTNLRKYQVIKVRVEKKIVVLKKVQCIPGVTKTAWRIANFNSVLELKVAEQTLQTFLEIKSLPQLPKF